MGFRNIMNNYFYGKQGKADMTVADLPANRRQLFGTVLRVRWSAMMGLNLLYLIAWIPAILWTGMNLVALLSATAPDAPAEAAVIGGDLSGLLSMWLLGLVPCIAITGPFNAGATYVLRNWARDQHSFILSDFWDAVKGNWKQALPVSIISGVMPFLTYTATRFYGGMAEQMPVFVAFAGIVAVVAILWSMATMLAYPMMVTYELKFGDLIRNSVLLTVGKLPFAVLFKALTLVVPAIAAWIIALAPGAEGYVLLLVGILYLVFMPTFNKLLTVSYANWLCETYLNPRIEGARTNIGLRPENCDDTEYHPEDDE